MNRLVFRDHADPDLITFLVGQDVTKRFEPEEKTHGQRGSRQQTTGQALAGLGPDLADGVSRHGSDRLNKISRSRLSRRGLVADFWTFASRARQRGNLRGVHHVVFGVGVLVSAPAVGGSDL